MRERGLAQSPRIWMLDGASASIRETRSEQLVVADGRWERVLRTGAALNNAARTTARPWSIYLRHGESLTCNRDAAMAWCRGASTSKGLARLASLSATDTRAHPDAAVVRIWRAWQRHGSPRIAECASCERTRESLRCPQHLASTKVGANLAKWSQSLAGASSWSTATRI